MTIKSLNLKEAREKAQKLQDDLGTVFKEAKSGDTYDYNKVEFFGADVKGNSVEVAKKVKALDNELNEVMEHVETLQGLEDMAGAHAGREKALRGFALPGGGGAKGNYRSEEDRFKALGEMATETKAFKDWVSGGCKEGVTLTLDVDPTDMLAAAVAFDTIGSKALMTTAAGFAPQSIRQPGFVEGLTRPVQVLDIIPTFKTGESSVKYMEETTRVHGAAEVAEGAAYGEAQFAFTEKESPVRKIGDSLPVTDEQLEDVPMMQGYISTRLPFGVRQRMDVQVVVGTGAAPQLRGLKNVVGTQTQAKGADPVPDAFYKAMTKIRLNGRALPSHHLIHPLDWSDIRLLRTADGVYIYGPPSDAGVDRLWGLPVVQTDADAEGTGYTGAFNPATVSLHERRGIDVQIGFVGTQFVEGKRTVRADTRAALVWWRPPAFCSVTGL